MEKITADLNSWIIQDGNYGDFHCGDRHSLAMEFGRARLRPSDAREVRCRHEQGCIYTVTAEVIFVNPMVWVIDFGIKAYWESPPPAFAHAGAWVEGKVFMGIDPCFYKDYLSEIPDMPNLFDEWLVKRIQLNTTSWTHSLSGDRKVLTRDGALETWTDRAATDAWNDDHCRASYLLHLEK
jgi:hypothetical protein